MPLIRTFSLRSVPPAKKLPAGKNPEHASHPLVKFGYHIFDRTVYVPAAKAAQEISSHKLENFKLLEVEGPIVFVPIPGPTRRRATPEERWDEMNIVSQLHTLKVGRMYYAIDRLKLDGDEWPDDEFSAAEICETLTMTKDGLHPAGKPQPGETIVYVSLSVDDGKLIAAVDSILSRYVRFERDRAAIALEMRSDDPRRDHQVPMVREIHYSERGQPWPVSLSVTPPVIRVPSLRPDLADSPEYVAAYLAGNVPPDKFYPRVWGAESNMVPVTFRSVKMR